MVETAFSVIGYDFGLPSKGNMTEDEAVGCVTKLRFANGVGEPFRLFAAEVVEGDAALKAEVVIWFVFAGVQDDRCDWAGAKRVKRTVIWSGDESRHFEGVRAANVVIPPCHKKRTPPGDVALAGVEQGGDQEVRGFPVVAGIAIPEKKIGSGSDFVELLDCFIIHVSIVPNDELSFGRRAIESAKRLPSTDFFASGGPRFSNGPHAIFCSRFESGEPEAEKVFALMDKTEVVAGDNAFRAVIILPFQATLGEIANSPDRINAIFARSNKIKRSADDVVGRREGRGGSVPRLSKA